MAKQRRKQQNKPVYPTGIHYIKDGEDYKLFKKFGRNNALNDPFYITSDLSEMIDEIENSCRKWKCAVNLKDLKKFINKHTEHEETSIPQSYFGK